MTRLDARTDRALAGKAMGTEGLLVFRWKLGDHELDSGVRGDEPETSPAWINAVDAAGAQGGEQA